MRRRVLVAAAAAVVLAGAGALAVWRPWSADPSRLETALAHAPQDGARFSWTDWAGVRSELGVELDAASPASRVGEFLNGAFERDLASTSALVSSAEILQTEFGFSPASVEWELFTQSESGAALLLRLDADTSTDDLADNLRRLGYEQDGDIWASSSISDPVTAQVSPELTFIRFLPDDGLLVSSDSAAGVAAAAKAAEKGGSDPLPGEVVDAVDGALSAALYTGAQACTELAMSQADATDEDQGRDLIAAAGKVNPLTAFAMAAVPGGGVVVAMGFENADQARTNADTRAGLAVGAAPGQGGTFPERFALSEVLADDAVVTMALHPVEGAYVLSDLSTGPLLFATC